MSKEQRLKKLRDIQLEAIYDVEFPLGVLKDVVAEIEQLEKELQNDKA
jgi:hypothetical protein